MQMWLVRINTWLGLVGFKLAVFLIGFFSLAITVACALFTVAGVFQLSTVDHPLSCKVLEIKIPVGRAKYRNRYLSVDCPNSERNDYLLVKKNAEIKEGDVVTAYPQALRKNRVRLDQPTPASRIGWFFATLFGFLGTTLGLMVGYGCMKHAGPKSFLRPILSEIDPKPVLTAALVLVTVFFYFDL